MSEREIADLVLKNKKQQDEIRILKWKIKNKNQQIKELSLLLNAKIKFRNEVKKCTKQ